jgi:capsular polysaccharide biosynthesis protein
MYGLSIFEQAQIFFNATAVIAIHGASLANLIFCKPNVSVFEILVDPQVPISIGKRFRGTEIGQPRLLQFVRTMDNEINPGAFFLNNRIKSCGNFHARFLTDGIRATY